MTDPAPTIDSVPKWPLIRIMLHRDLHTAAPLLTVAGQPINVPAGQNPHLLGVLAAAQEAQHLGRPVRAVAVDGDQEYPMIVHPDGSTDDLTTNTKKRRPTRGSGGPWRLPAGLAIGIVGLLVLVGLATSLIVIAPVANDTAAPAPPPTSNTPTPPPAPPPAPPAIPTPQPSPPAPIAPPKVVPVPVVPPAVVPPPITFAPGPQPPSPVTRAKPSTPRRTATPRPTPKPRVKPTPIPAPPAPPVAQSPLSSGQVRLGADGYYCLTSNGAYVFGEACSNNRDAQAWTFHAGQLRHGTSCLTLTGASAGLAPCTSGDRQSWTSAGPGGIQHQASGQCLIHTKGDGISVPIALGRCGP